MSELAVEKKESRGRPKLPENTIKDLELKIETLKKIIKDKENPVAELKELAEILRLVQRAMKGLASEDDNFFGLIDVKDIRERTRLDETAVLSHSAMRLAYSMFPEFKLFNDIAEMEDPYYISEDGEGRKEAILQTQAKTKLEGPMVLNMPNSNGGLAQNEQPQQQPKKAGFMDKFRKRF